MKSLADAVSGAGLEQYAEVALLIFFAVFVAVTLRVLAANKDSLDRASTLPFSDEERDGARGANATDPSHSPAASSAGGAAHVDR